VSLLIAFLLLAFTCPVPALAAIATLVACDRVATVTTRVLVAPTATLAAEDNASRVATTNDLEL
jgi:hypothetical protein